MILKKEHSNSLKLSGFSLKHYRKQLQILRMANNGESLGSVGANYREANESLSKKDFLMRIKISRKEAKESAYWLRLIHETNNLKNADEAISLDKRGR